MTLCESRGTTHHPQVLYACRTGNPTRGCRLGALGRRISSRPLDRRWGRTTWGRWDHHDHGGPEAPVDVTRRRSVSVVGSYTAVPEVDVEVVPLRRVYPPDAEIPHEVVADHDRAEGVAPTLRGVRPGHRCRSPTVTPPLESFGCGTSRPGRAPVGVSVWELVTTGRVCLDGSLPNP